MRSYVALALILAFGLNAEGVLAETTAIAYDGGFGAAVQVVTSDQPAGIIAGDPGTGATFDNPHFYHTVSGELENYNPETGGFGGPVTIGLPELAGRFGLFAGANGDGTDEFGLDFYSGAELVGSDSFTLPAGAPSTPVAAAFSSNLAFDSVVLTAPGNGFMRINDDSIRFEAVFTPDMDTDGIGNGADNCTELANEDQRDTDNDNIGNACDPDLNNDCIVNPIDLGILRARFFTTDPDADFNGDGVVNPQDLGIFRSFFFGPPGPSGQPNRCNGGAVADFDGDLRSDLLVGVPGDVVINDIGLDYDQGSVDVFYASSLPDGTISQVSPGIGGGPENDDFFGAAVAAGDFNGDGFSDAAIGVPGENLGTFDFDAGMLHIVYGSLDGLSLNGDPLLPLTWNQDSSDAWGGVYGGVEAGDKFAASFAVGDFDNDGYDDLAVGVPGEEIGSIEGAGYVQVFHGSDEGITTRRQQGWDQTDSPTSTPEAEDDFGAALVTGNFNCDDYDDLAIGIPGEGIGSAGDAGSVMVLYGTGNGLSIAGYQEWNQNSPDIEGTAETNDFFGASLASGDFNGDHCDDLAIGVPEENQSSVLFDTGAVHILHGTGGGLTATGSEFFDAGDVVIDYDVDLSTPAAQLGRSLAAGDFNGDGLDDLGVGVPGLPLPFCAALLRYSGELVGLETRFVGLVAGTCSDDFNSDYGETMTVLDRNGDGYDDLAIGDPGLGILFQGNVGRVELFYGKASRFIPVDFADEVFAPFGLEPGDKFGAALPGAPRSFSIF